MPINSEPRGHSRIGEERKEEKEKKTKKERKNNEGYVFLMCILNDSQ